MRRITTTLFSVLFLLSVLTFSVSAQTVPDAYKPLIDQYISALTGATNYDTAELGDFGGGAFINPTGEIYDFLGFTVADINGDENPELFVGSDWSGEGNYSWAAVYTLENNQPKKLISHQGSDNDIFLLGDLSGIGHPEWSNCLYALGGWQDGYVYDFYRLDGTSLTKVGESKDYGVASYRVAPGTFITFNQYRSNASAPTQITVEEGPEGTIYRLYNSQTGEHLYSPDHNEAQTLANSGWNYEGFGWTAPTEGDAVYRLFNPSLNDHLYTTDTNEVNVLTSSGWQADNNGQPLFYSGGDRPIYRLYQESTGRHHLTTDENEYNTLPGSGWLQEGVKLHGIG